MSRVMAHVLYSADIPRAFAAFDKVRRPRSQAQVQSAYESGLLYDLQLPECKDDMEKVKQKLATKNAWIWEHDLEADVQEAERAFTAGAARL